MTIEQALKTGLEHHQAKRLAEAESWYRQVLQSAPRHPHALRLLGRIALARNQNDAAIDLLRRAIAAAPAISAFHNDLAIALKRVGRTVESMAASQAAIRCQPDNFEAVNNLGNCHLELEDYPQAISAYRQALKIQPESADVHRNLGIALREQGSLDEAIPPLRRAIQLDPRDARAYCDLARTLRDPEQLEEAIRLYEKAIAMNPSNPTPYCYLGNLLAEQENFLQALPLYDRAIELFPDYDDAHYNRGMALGSLGRSVEAIAAYHKVLTLKPEHAKTHYNLGLELKRQGRIEESIASYRRALELQPNYIEALNNLGGIWKDQGRLDDAMTCFAKALELVPDYRDAQENMLYCMAFDVRYSAADIFAAGAAWNEKHGSPLKGTLGVHLNERDSDRRLRIGYVSPNLREHPVGRFMRALLLSHDRSMIEVYCYSDARSMDDLSEQMKACCYAWRSTRKLTHEQLARRVREDRIDILVDLALHMADNRLMVFARKPAPVQVTFAGYPGSTGLEAIDYRLTDPYLDPPGVGDEFYSEKSIRLPDTFWCDHLLDEDPQVGELPAQNNGCITFGTLNNPCKLSDEILRHWASILGQVGGSRLLLQVPDDPTRQRVQTQLAAGGVEAHRVDFVGFQKREDYLRTYQRFDIGLDTWPYNGHATSFDSFWMGVPVVTLVGPTVVGRAGLSQLMNLGLPELIGHTPEEFVRIAVDLSTDLPRLAALRAGLRERMRSSPLMDAPRFARAMEAAYRQMWRTWCESGS